MCTPNRTQSSGRYVHIQQNTKFRNICAHQTEHNNLINHMTEKPHPQLDINARYKRYIDTNRCVCKSIQHHTQQYKVTTKLCCYLLKVCLYMKYWRT